MAARIALLLLLFGAKVSFGQSFPGWVTRFERDVNRFRYESTVRSRVGVGVWTAEAEALFRTDGFEGFGQQLTLRDELAARIRIDRGPFGVRSRTLAFPQSRVLTHETLAGWTYRWQGGEADLRGGMAADQRPGARLSSSPPLRTDVGPAGAFRLGQEVHPEWGIAQGTLEIRGALLSPRASGEIRATGQALYLAGPLELEAETRASRFMRDSYQAASFLNRDLPQEETVERTYTDTLLVRIVARTEPFRGVTMQAATDGSFAARRVRSLRAAQDALVYDTDVERRAAGFTAEMQYSHGNLRATAAMEAQASVERRTLMNAGSLPPAQATQTRDLLRQADFDRGFLGVRGQVEWSSPRAALGLLASANMLRHDTPELNPDDRDEARRFVQGHFGWRLSPTLQSEITLLASENHAVYLKRERSAESARQRSLRLRPAVVWTPGTAILRLGSEVRATYTRDDFQLPGRASRDQAARELRHELSADLPFVYPLRLRAEGSRADLRLGRLVPDRFAEIPLDTLITTLGEFRLVAPGKVTAEAGVRFFVRDGFQRALTVTWQREGVEGSRTITRPGRQQYVQAGPVSRIVWHPAEKTRVSFEGWWMRQNVRATLYGALPAADAAFIQNAARRINRRTLPAATLSVQWTW